MAEIFYHQITDKNAPKRLQGLIVMAILSAEKGEQGELRFQIDMPEEPTNQELGYFRWMTGELVDKLSDQTSIDFTARPLEKVKI